MVAGELVEACGDAPELLELAEEPFDEIASSIDVRWEGTADPSSGRAWHMGGEG